MADRGRAAHRDPPRTTSSRSGPPGFEALVDEIGGVTGPVRHRVRGPGERPRRRAGAQPDERAAGQPSSPGPASSRATTSPGRPTTSASWRRSSPSCAARRTTRGSSRAAPSRPCSTSRRPCPLCELYRFAQAVTQVDPAQTDTCVLTGPTGVEDVGERRLPRRGDGPAGGRPTPPTTPSSPTGVPGSTSAEPGVAGQHDRLRAVGDLQLHEDVARVVAHRLGREAELLGDLGVLPCRPR